MFTFCNISLLIKKCPDNMTEQNCPLREYIRKSPLFLAESHILYSSEVFHLTPHDDFNREKLIQTYDEMHAICEKCKIDQKQNSK